MYREPEAHVTSIFQHMLMNLFIAIVKNMDTRTGGEFGQNLSFSIKKHVDMELLQICRSVN